MLDLGTSISSATDLRGGLLPSSRAKPMRAGNSGERSGRQHRIRQSRVTRGGELWPSTPWGAPPSAYSPASTGADLGEAPDGASSAAAVAHARLLVQGHSAMRRGKGWQGESVALATDPTNSDTFATGGDDGTVRIWSVAEHRLLAIRTLPLSVSALAYTSDGLHLAVGCVKGGMYILYADRLRRWLSP